MWLTPKVSNMRHQTLVRFTPTKATATKMLDRVALTKGLHLCAVKKNNMKGKNRDLNRYYTAIRAPFEHVFSKQNKRVRYRGIAKNQFSAFMQEISFNFKRLVVLSQQFHQDRQPIKAWQGIAAPKPLEINKNHQKTTNQNAKNPTNSKKIRAKNLS